MLISDVDAPKYYYYCFVWKLSQTYFDHFFGGTLRYFRESVGSYRKTGDVSVVPCNCTQLYKVVSVFGLRADG